jgi:hypothetical protein
MMDFANAISKTEVVPAAFRGKPDSILAVIQTGLEMGLTPMASLRSFNNIQGTVVLKPESAMGLIRSKGLIKNFSITHSGQGNSLVVTVSGQRVGDSQEYTVRFSWADAVQAQLHNKDMYKRFPLRMLTARAIGFFCKDLFPDVLSGLPISEPDDTTEAMSEPAYPASSIPTVALPMDKPKSPISNAAKRVQKLQPPIAVVPEEDHETEEKEEEPQKQNGNPPTDPVSLTNNRTDDSGHIYPEFLEDIVASFLPQAQAMTVEESKAMVARMSALDKSAFNKWKSINVHADPKINNRLILLLACEGFLPPNCDQFTLPDSNGNTATDNNGA